MGRRTGNRIFEHERTETSRRVLVLSPQPFFEERGTPIAVRDVCRALVELGFQVDLLTLPVGERIEMPGVNVIRVANPLGVESIPIGFSGHKLVFDALMVFKLARLAARFAYYRFHAVEEAVYLTALIPGIRSKSVVYDMASSLAQHFEAPLPRKILNWLEERILRRVGYVFCSAGLRERVAKHCRAEFQEWWFPPPSPIGDVIPRAQLRAALGIEPDQKAIVYAGSLASYQGLDDVLAAIPEVVARDDRAVFMIVGGSAAESRRFFLAVPEHVRSAVRILPRLARPLVADFYAAADILLSPRNECDNVPLKIFEYLAAGKAIVASDVMGHRAVLNNDVAEFYLPGTDQLGDVLAALLADDARRAQLACAAGKLADQRLGWPRFRASLNDAYPDAAENLTYLPSRDGQRAEEAVEQANAARRALLVSLRTPSEQCAFGGCDRISSER